jgi:magnesium transporter
MSTEALLLEAFAAKYPEELSRLVERLTPAAFAEVLAALPVARAANLAVHAMPLAAALALSELDSERAVALLLEIEPRPAALICVRLGAVERERLYDALPAASAAGLRSLTEYGAARAGGRIDPRVPMLPETLAVAEVLDRLRASPASALNYAYAVDGERRLTGVVNLRELMGAPADATLAAIMTREPTALFADDPLETVVSHPAFRRHHALPVIDRDGRLLGALRYSAFRAVEAELGERAPATHTVQAASALAELCALGVSAVTHLAGVTLELSPERSSDDVR